MILAEYGDMVLQYYTPFRVIGVHALRNALLPVATLDRFDDLPIPFRAIATDLATGEPVVLEHGSLALALRASMSAPGVFAPVEIDGRVLVDGGVAENLPVDVAKSMGVDIVIAVDVNENVYFNNAPIDVSQLRDRLIEREKAATAGNLPEVHIRADKAVRFEAVGRVILACQQAGVRKVGFITLPVAIGG